MDISVPPEAEKTSQLSYAEADKASPASLCENEAPITECEPPKPVNGLTLGQTLKDELRRSCLRISMDKKPKEEPASLPLFENIQPLFDNVPCSSPNVQSTPPPSVNGSPTTDTSNERRRRPRRNPVWLHFVVEEGLAKCRQCDYSTKSVFSTNLKVHLKSHHKELHQQVMQAEEQMALATAKVQNGNAMRSPKEPLRIAPRRFPTHLSAVDQQRLLELQQRIMNSNGISANLFNSPIPAVQSIVTATQFNEPTTSMKVLTDLLSTQTPLASTLKQEKLTPFEAMIKHEPLPAVSFDAAKTVTPTALAETLGSPGSLDRRQKRKRLRRHPVWQYFGDVDEKIVGCVMCTFRTVSAFSTNLKMHLKAHHKEEYLKVMEQELEQRQDEESMGVVSEEASPSQEATANGRFKRRRRTVEELQVIVDKAKSTLEKDKWRQTANGSLFAGPQFIANPTPVLDTEKMAGMSATEKLEAMVGFLCADNGSSEAGLPSPATEYSDSEQQNSTEASTSPAEPCEGTLGADALMNIDGNPEDFRALMRQISKIPSEGANGQFVKNFKRQTQNLMLSKLVKRVGSASIFLTPEFQNFVLSWAPDFQFPSADELHSILAKNGYKH